MLDSRLSILKLDSQLGLILQIKLFEFKIFWPDSQHC